MDLDEKAYLRIERGQRQPSAFHAFALMVIFEGVPWEILKQSAPPLEKGIWPHRVYKGRRDLIWRWHRGLFRKAVYSSSLLRRARQTTQAVDWNRHSPFVEPYHQELPAFTRAVHYRTGRLDLPYLGACRQRTPLVRMGPPLLEAI